MPDNFLPPGWGPASFDERDLDAVLAGNTADVDVRLRPVVDVLAALSAGPMPAELYGETNAMAEFRALGLGEAERRMGSAPTMLLEVLPAGQRAGRPGRRPARHRVRPGRRHPVRGAALRPALLSAFAAAAVIVLAVLVTGNFAAPFRAIAHMASPSAGTPSATEATGRSKAPGVETSSSALYTTTPPPATYSTAPSPSPSETCRNYYSFIKHPQGPSPWATQLTLWHQLTKLVGSDSWGKVSQYCAQYVKDLFPAGQNQPSEHPEPGNQNIGQQAGGAANSRPGAVNSTASTSQGSNSHGEAPGSASNP